MKTNTSKNNCRFAVLGSTRGSSLAPILEAYKKEQFQSELSVVISNKKNSGILEKAKNDGIESLWIGVNGRDRESYDRELTSALEARNIDFILLIGFLRILSPYFVNHWKNRVINVHPSLLPKYSGMMDMSIHEAAIENNDQESGCSIHIVNEEVDGGPIILQKKCDIENGMTPEMLKKRVQELESNAFLEFLQSPQSFIKL